MNRPLGYATVQVLQAIASGYLYGFDIMDATGLPSGTVYPILSKLEDSGFVKSRWEDPRIARREKRPPRRSYEITGDGREALTDSVEKLRTLTGAGIKPAATPRKATS
jgi:PadR family transcriptional regulator, regulatory protein PadR